MNKSDMLTILMPMAAAFGKQVNADTVQAFMLVLSRFPRLRVYRAAHKQIEKSRYFPRPSELLESVLIDEQGYWQPPTDPLDEILMWTMVKNGTSDPYELTQDDIDMAYKTVGREQEKDEKPQPSRPVKLTQERNHVLVAG